jgi:hypothetical protein
MVYRGVPLENGCGPKLACVNRLFQGYRGSELETLTSTPALGQQHSKSIYYNCCGRGAPKDMFVLVLFYPYTKPQMSLATPSTLLQPTDVSSQ